MLICPSLALPFHNRQCSRSHFSSTITALRRHPRRIIGRQATGCLLEVLEPYADVEPVENRQLGDAGISENRAADPAHPSVKKRSAPCPWFVRPRRGFGRSGTLTSVSVLATAPKACRPHQVSVLTLPTRTSKYQLAVLTAVDKRVVQGSRRRPPPPFLGLVTAAIRTVPAPIFSVCRRARSQDPFRCINRENTCFSRSTATPVRHQGGKMRLKLVEFRRRPAMRTANQRCSLDRVTSRTAKTGKTHRHLAKMRVATTWFHGSPLRCGQTPLQLRHSGR